MTCHFCAYEMSFVGTPNFDVVASQRAPDELKPCNNFNPDAPYLLQMLIDKGVHFDDVSRPKKIEILKRLYYNVGNDEESFNNYRAFWV
jgi:hypothetical protein